MLCELGDHMREVVVGARGMDMAEVEGRTDGRHHLRHRPRRRRRPCGWFEQHWPGVELVSEGLDEPVVVGRVPEWTVIVDTIDGTRG